MKSATPSRELGQEGGSPSEEDGPLSKDHDIKSPSQATNGYR
ncbi:MAG: hypothetical protein ABSF22_13890 [Bryobacteraceae bacterium]